MRQKDTLPFICVSTIFMFSVQRIPRCYVSMKSVHHKFFSCTSQNSKSKFYMNFHSNVCSLNKKTSEREWKNIEVFEMGFCICIIRNNIYRFRISWNNKLENRLQTETADHKISNILFHVIDVRPCSKNQVFGLWFHWNCIYSVNDRIHQCSW